MKLEKIISLANKKTEIRFLAMVRSLRATGCNLPVWVIPYNNDKFELPDNCIWWEIDEMISWLDVNKAHKMMRKYQCLVTTNYQYVDSDIVFLRNPEEVLSDVNGFITSCGHWRNPQHTYIDETIKLYKGSSTNWQKHSFNAGQYACDVMLFNIDELKKIVEDPKYKDICLTSKTFDQVSLNLLIYLSKVPVVNLTLPTYNMESTWAGDYLGAYEKYWVDYNVKPYIIHWAGCPMDLNRPIDELFLSYLTKEERDVWNLQVKRQSAQRKSFNEIFFRNVRKLKRKLFS